MNAQVETVFRREWGRAVAVVTRLTGDLGLAEDAVSEALALALGRWADGPAPSDPSGWLITVAKNHAVDRIRREARRSGKEEAAVRLLNGRGPPPPPGPYQLQAAIAACHAAAASAGDTDWVQIAALYAALASHEPSPVVHANRAVAVAMADGPAAGLAILDGLTGDARAAGWHLLHACRADLLRKLGRTAEAGDAYRAALALGPPPAERAFLIERLSETGEF